VRVCKPDVVHRSRRYRRPVKGAAIGGAGGGGEGGGRAVVVAASVRGICGRVRWLVEVMLTACVVAAGRLWV
jgi:hypothetical protein